MNVQDNHLKEQQKFNFKKVVNRLAYKILKML